MSATTTCTNPRCTCEVCTCTECGCGVARVGDAELQVMEILWAEPGRDRTGRDVADLLPDYAYTTVATMLDRLVHKGLVSRRMDGRLITSPPSGRGPTTPLT